MFAESIGQTKEDLWNIQLWGRVYLRKVYMEKYLLVQTSCSTQSEAESLAESVIEARLAACAQLLPALCSIYRWQGSIERNEEVLLLFKTRSTLLEQLTEWIRARHSYEVPEIIATPISSGSPDYLAWIENETC